jgi:hypothetical protein
MQGQTEGSYFIQALLCNLQKHNLELSKLVGIFTDGALSIVSSRMVCCLLYKHMHELGLQNEMQYHCIVHQQNLTKLMYKQTVTDIVSAVNFLVHVG